MVSGRYNQLYSQGAAAMRTLATRTLTTFIIWPHRMHEVQECGLLLSVVCVSVCLTRRASVSHAKTAEPIELTFKMWTRVDPINHVLNGDPIPARVVTHCGGKEVINIRHAQTCL